MTNSSSPEPVDLSDPSISPHRLQELAQTHPQQWDEILVHPSIYPGLADWIRDRQAELAATGGGEQGDEYDASDQDAVDEAAAEEAQDAAASPGAQADLTDDMQGTDAPVADAGQPTWAMPDGVDDSYALQSEQQSPEQQTWSWSEPMGQPSSHEPAGAQQFGYGAAYAQPQQFGQPTQRGASRVDLESARTWGLFVAGGAAFLSLFGFIFTPTLDYNLPFGSHLSAGGWIIVLLFIATVALSLVQLLKPSSWMRFFFIAVSLAAGFLMIGRALTLIGFFTMRYTGFSVLWLLFMSLVLVAGALMYLAPRPSDEQPASTRQPTGQQEYYGAPQQYGQQPGYGQQHTGSPHFPSGPQQYGGYSPGGPQQ